jgi:hypothetical protein
MTRDHSRELEQQMENFASKLLQDEVAVYNKRMSSSIIFDLKKNKIPNKFLEEFSVLAIIL